jgi:HAD superfamily hydrolase (TIGR01549 family)
MAAVVFDWDGTLVDTLPAIFRANVATLERYGIPFDEAAYRSAFAPDWRLMYRRLGVPEADLEAAGRHWTDRYAASEGLRPFPGAALALERLAAAGYRLGIVTAGHRHLVEAQLARFGMAGRIGAMVCGDDPGVPAKPDPTPLRLVLDALGALDAERRPVPGSAYVGDVPDDMHLARAAGVSGVGVVNLLGTPEELTAAGADRVVPSVAAWVEELLGPEASA